MKWMSRAGWLALLVFFLPASVRANEPNDTPQQATPIVSGVPVTGYISTANDIDYYTFTIAGTQHVRVDLTIPTGTTYGVAILGSGTFGPQVLTQNSGGGAGAPRRLDWTLTPGTYWVRVANECCGSPTHHATQPYVLTLTAPQPGDTFEPNDTAATAAPLPSGSPLTSYIATANDVDFYTFSVATTQHVRVDLTIPAGTTYNVAILGPGSFGPQVLTQNSGGGAGVPRRLDWTLTPGTYWVRVINECCGFPTYHATQPYVLTLTAPQPGDTFEPNDTAASAAPLPSGNPRTSYIATANDVDFYTFSVATTQHVRVDLSIPAGTTYNVAILGPGTFGPQVLTQNSGGGAGVPRRLDWTLTPGTYWVRVINECCGSPTYHATQPYVLTLTAPQPGDTFEPNDTAATAAPLPGGNPRTSYIATANDVDFYVFSIGTTQQVRLDLSIPAGTTYGLALLGPGTFGPQVLTQNSGGGAGVPRRLDWTLAPGTYWVRVINECCGFPTYHATQPYVLTLRADGVTAPGGPPAITALSPTSLVASEANQLVTASGTGFQGGQTVTVGLPGGGTSTLSGTQIQNVTANSFQMVVTLADPGSYWLRVNATGGSSSQFGFTVNPGTSPPTTVTGLSPAVPIASGSNQLVTVIGTGFQSGQTVTVGLPGGGTSTLSGTQIQNVSGTSFQMVVTLAHPGAYWLRVDTGSVSSTLFPFTVISAGTPPQVTALNPAAPTPSGFNQVVSVVGSGFQSEMTVTVGLPGGGTSTLSGVQIQNAMPSAFQMVVTLADAGTYWLRVHTTAGSSAAHFFAVGDTAAPRPGLDDYPFRDRACGNYTNTGVDPWGFYFNECTSFVAWRINRDAGEWTTAFNNGMNGRLKGIRSKQCPSVEGRLSNAECWADQLSAIGYPVNETPAVGAIAHWTGGEINFAAGHVAYVRAVNPDGTVVIEEYNFQRCAYTERTVKAPRYIHVNANQRAMTSIAPTADAVDLATTGGVVRLAFGSVSASGTASVTHEQRDAGSLGTLPAGFVPVASAVFDVVTDTVFGTVSVCLPYTLAQLESSNLSEDSLRVLHLAAGATAWTIAESTVDTVARRVCGRVSTLSHFVVAGQPSSLTTRYLAEGATSTFFDTRLALLNPTETDTTATISFLTGTGATVEHAVAVPAMSRRTVQPRGIAGLEVAEFSTIVDASESLIVDRTMSWDATGYGSHAETAVASPATTWYLAEGATHSGFNLFYLLQNPSPVPTRVRVRYLLGSGSPLEKEYDLPPVSRTNIWVNVEEFAGQGQALASAEPSAVIESLDGTPIIVERAMYLSNQGRLFNAGHASMGVTTPSTQWFLAEGATGDYFDLFVLIANPNDEDATVTVTYLLGAGTTFTRDLVAPANSRTSIWVDMEEIPGVPGRPLKDVAVSTTVTSTNAVPIIVERAMWWPGSAGSWHEAHNSAASTVTGTRWALAEGEVGGQRGYETYILIANTSAHAGSATVTLLFEDGTSAVRAYPLLPNSRTNVPVAVDFAEAHGRRFGAIVESTGTTPAEIVVERAMYSNAAGVQWAAGTNALATRLP